MAKVLLTRVHFCEHCFFAGRPRPGDKFVTIGRTHAEYIIRNVKRIGTRGFTPHITELIESKQGKTTYWRYCAIDGCGCRLEKKKDGNYLIKVSEKTASTIPISDWNAMVNYRNDPQYVLD